MQTVGMSGYILGTLVIPVTCLPWAHAHNCYLCGIQASASLTQVETPTMAPNCYLSTVPQRQFLPEYKSQKSRVEQGPAPLKAGAPRPLSAPAGKELLSIVYVGGVMVPAWGSLLNHQSRRPSDGNNDDIGYHLPHILMEDGTWYGSGSQPSRCCNPLLWCSMLW